jgi:hypothetical protein
MGRPLKPLHAYPSAIRKLALAAKSASGIFPIRIPFATATEAMAYRVSFYTYRRTLRAHVQSTKAVDSIVYQEADCAELISSPRIADAPDAPNGQFYCIFRLTADEPTAKHGNNVLDSLLAGIDLPEERQEHLSPIHSMPYEAPATSEPAKRPSKRIDPEEESFLFSYRDSAYKVPKSHISPDLHDLSADALQAMFVNGLIDLPLSTADYKV